MNITFHYKHRDHSFNAEETWTMIRHLIRQGHPDHEVFVLDGPEIIGRANMQQLLDMQRSGY